MIIKKIKDKGLRSHLRERLLHLLERINNSTTVDQIETELIAMGIKYALDYYGVKNVPAGTNEVVAEEVVKCLEKMNLKLQDHLRT